MAETASARIRVRELTKRYGSLEAVRGVSFDVADGEIFGLLGPNGAGKTSILECLLGLRVPDSGSIEIGGVDALRDPQAVRSGVGAQIQQASLQDKITSREALDFYGSFYRDRAHSQELIDRFELGEKADAPFDSLSQGQRQRLLLALAFVNNPRLVVLDEPTAGLDVHARRDLLRLIGALRGRGVTVILSTHHLQDAEDLCDRIAVIDGGRILAVDTPKRLIAGSMTRPRIILKTERPVPPAELQSLAAVLGSSVDGVTCELETRDVGATLTDVAARLGASANAILDIQVRRPTLEDVFVELTEKAPGDRHGRDPR